MTMSASVFTQQRLPGPFGSAALQEQQSNSRKKRKTCKLLTTYGGPSTGPTSGGCSTRSSNGLLAQYPSEVTLIRRSVGGLGEKSKG